MGHQEKDQIDFDLDTFVELFDTAMTSTNPAVQKAFKNLMMIAALVHAKQDGLDYPQGPLQALVSEIRELRQRVKVLESQHNPTYRPIVPPVITTPNTPWPGTYPNTNPNWPTGTVICKSEEC